MPSELIESELFGHEKGSFTGATVRHAGKFEQAHGGTLFLDEIGDMPLAMQAKLLRVLEEGQVERVGGDRPVTVDVRVVVATHRNLEELVRAGRLPPGPLSPHLRLPAAAAAIARAHRGHPAAGRTLRPAGLGRRTAGSEAVRGRTRSKSCCRYSWPGNVRELRNVVERLLLLSGPVVDTAAVRLALPQIERNRPATRQPAERGTLAERTEQFEREVILATLKRHQKMTEAARALGLERSHLYKKCQQLGIDLRALRRANEMGPGLTTAAAYASRFGLALKISEDGIVSFYRAGACVWEI